MSAEKRTNLELRVSVTASRLRELLRPVVLMSFLCTALPAVAQVTSEVEESSASGSDITRPSHRIDLRVESENGEDEHLLTSTIRYEQPILLNKDWQINFRADVPFVHSKEDPGDGEPDEKSSGLGDLLVQAIFVRHLGEEEGFGLGAQFILPTASKDALGDGKWRLRPTVGYRWPVPAITEGTYFQLLARYDFSFAGDEDREKIRELQFAPNLEIEFPGEAYLSFFPSTDIRYDFRTNELFVPANVEVGKSWGRLVVSAEGGVGLIKGDEPPYDWKLEGRIGWKF